MREYNTFLLFGVAFVLAGTMFAAAQDMDTTITNTNGDQFIIDGKSTSWSVDNVEDENQTFILIPKEGQSAAKASIQKGSKVTRFEAEKITFTPNQERFFLEGNAKIEADEELAVGPKSIRFDPDKNFMIIKGTDKIYAQSRYRLPDGRLMQTYGRTLRFYFEIIDDSRRLKRVEKTLKIED